MQFGSDGNQTAEGASSHHGQCRSRSTAHRVGMFARMIGLPAGTRIWIAAGGTGLRGGFSGVSGVGETGLPGEPFFGHVFLFFGGRGELIKMVWGGRGGGCLFS